MSQIAQEVEVLTAGRYTSRHLRFLLSHKRRKRIPTPTWQRWRSALNIHPDQDGLYWEEDKQALEGLIVALKAGWTIAKYKQFLESQTHAHQQTRNEPTERTIDVSAESAKG